MEDIKICIDLLLTKDNEYVNGLLKLNADADGNIVLKYDSSCYKNISIGMIIEYTEEFIKLYHNEVSIYANTIEECIAQYSSKANDITIKTNFINYENYLYDNCILFLNTEVQDTSIINKYKYRRIIINNTNVVQLNVYTEILEILLWHPNNIDLSNVKATHIFAMPGNNIKLNTEYTKSIVCNESIVRGNSCGSIVFASTDFADVFTVWPQLVARYSERIILNTNHPLAQYFPTVMPDCDNKIRHLIAQYEANVKRYGTTKSAKF